MTPSIAEVSTVVGGYRVRLRGELHIVDKRRRCTCQRQHCVAIAAVAAYLRAGGLRAPDAAAAALPPVVCCPICQAPAVGSLARKHWQCTSDHSHYFLWRVQRLRQARDALLSTAPPYVHEVLAAFASTEARAAFLSNHALTYSAGA